MKSFSCALFRCFSPLLVVLAAAAPALSAPSAHEAFQEQVKAERAPGFWDDRRRGWFYFEDPVEQEEPAEKPAEQASPAPESLPTAKDFTYEELWNMHPKKFQEVFTNTVDKGVQTLSEEDARAVMMMADITQKKGRAFANVTSFVAQTTPEFNIMKDSPVTSPGRKAQYAQQSMAISAVLNQASQDHGLLYFYSPTCPYCVEESKILGQFVRETGWDVKPVDINQQPDLAVQFGVETTPTVLLVKTGVDKPFPVALGVTSESDLKKNIYRGMRLLAGDISPENFSLYEFQRGSTLDPLAGLNHSRPQQGGHR